MENNFEETVVTEEAEVTQPAAPEQPAEKKSFSDSVKDFSEKLDLEGKSKALMEGGTNLWGKLKALPKKVWIMIGAGAAALVAAIVLIAILTNTYKTPVSIMQSLENRKSYISSQDALLKQLNGYATKEVKAIIKIAKKAEDYKEDLKEDKEDFKESIEEMKEEYGSNYKIKYKVEDKEKLDRDDVKDFRDSLRDRAKSLAESIDEFIDEADSDDWEDMADEMGISKSQAKDLAKAALKLAKKLKSAKITAGYELSGTRTLSGKELDEPMESEWSMVVYKVDGRWVSQSTLSSLYFLAAALG